MLVSQSLEALGAAAGFCTTFAFVPQIIKIHRQGGRDLSYGMLVFYLTGVLLWLAYGIVLRSPSIIAANLATSLLIVIAIGLKGWKERRMAADNMMPQRMAGRS